MEEQKQIWRFTFGTGQEHAGYCKPIFGTWASARKKMFELYGDKWCFQYSEKQWEEIKNDKSRYWPMEQDLELVDAEEV